MCLVLNILWHGIKRFLKFVYMFFNCSVND